MAKFDKFQVMAKIAAAPMVPVFYHKDVEVCKNVIKASITRTWKFVRT